MSENVKETENKNTGEIEKIDILTLIAAFWNGFKKLWIVMLVIVVVCTLRSYFATSFSYTPQYVAYATVSVTTPGGSYNNIESAQEMAAVFPYILTSGVLEDVVMNDMGLDYLPGTISVEAEDGMNMLTISVSSNDPQLAYDTLTSVIKNYPEVAEYIFGETYLQILDETGIPSDTQKEVVIRGSYKRGALQGIVISAVILCLYVFLKRTVRTKEQLNKRINLHDLGSLQYVKTKKRKNAEYNDLTLLNPRLAPGYEESVRRLRIRVMREAEKLNGGVIMVTSSVPGEGKTTIAVNLALALAGNGKRVALLDCDLRHPSDREILGLDDGEGLYEILTKQTNPADLLVTGKDLGMDEEMSFCFLPGGKAVEDGSRLLGTERMKTVIDILAENSDYVILDSAPAGVLTDAGILAQYADCVVFVVKKDYARADHILEGMEELAESRLHLVGGILNGV